MFTVIVPDETQRQCAAVDDATLNALTEFAKQLAQAAGATILPQFRQALAVENKVGGGFDPVTEADRGAECVMRELIQSTYPEHSILGEEFGHHQGSSEFTWVLDPIDGTRSFISGVPLWGTLIGLCHGAHPILGVVAQPYIGELFVGNRFGAYCERNGERVALSTRSCASLSEAITMCTSTDMFKGEEVTAFDRVASKSQLVRHGADCYAYALLANGFVDVVVESSMNAYDYAALIPVIQAAGGHLGNWAGGAQMQRQVLALGDAALLPEVTELLSEACE